MAQTAAEVIVQTLIDWEVDTIFGIPGDGINGIMEALRKNQDKIRFIQTRHEESAAFMACGYAKFTDKLGVCIATSGPGGIHLLNGLYDAKLDGQPVLAIRTALTRRGVAHITVPVDIQDQPLNKDERSARNKANHVSDVFARGARRPQPGEIEAAAHLLNAGKKVAILAGRGALKAGDLLERAAETLGAPIIKALLGKSCVPDDSPYTTGGLGLLGTLPSEEAMQECDTLLIVGSTLPYIEFYPKIGQAKCVQIDIDAARISLRYPADVALVGDSVETLDALLPHLKPKGKSFLEKAQKGMQEWNELMVNRGTATDMPMKPQVVAYELGKRLKADALVAGDSGTNTTWWARQIPSLRGQLHWCSGNLATMACGFPYAIAAQIAHPNRTVIAWVGDGGFTMLMGELATVVKYKLPVKIFIIKNNSLGQIKWEQMVFLGNPEYMCDLQPIDFAAVAKAFGVASFTINHPSEAGRIIETALAVQGPALIEAVVDENEPPMPAKINATQAIHFAESMAKGTRDWEKIAATIAKDRVRELV